LSSKLIRLLFRFLERVATNHYQVHQVKSFASRLVFNNWLNGLNIVCRCLQRNINAKKVLLN
jgi:hypothetical protein